MIVDNLNIAENILPSEEAELLAALGEGDDDESFEKLFSKLSLMKGNVMFFIM